MFSCFTALAYFISWLTYIPFTMSSLAVSIGNLRLTINAWCCLDERVMDEAIMICREKGGGQMLNPAKHSRLFHSTHGLPFFVLVPNKWVCPRT